MNAATVSARFAELFPKSNLIGLLSLGIKPADLDDFARTAYWELIDEIRVRYLSSLTRDEAAKIIEASDGCIAHPENDDIDWSTDEFINDWNALHRGEEAIAR
mgnify:CR=1 FL=1